MMPLKYYYFFATGLPIINSLNRNFYKIFYKYNYKDQDLSSLINAVYNTFEDKHKYLIAKRINLISIAQNFY
jgi:DUF1365 family protein